MKKVRKRRSKGEGTLYQKPGGLWVGRLRKKGYPAIEVYGKTAAEAAENLRVARNRRTTIPVARITVKEWLARWLIDSAGEYAAGSIELYGSISEKHINPHIGHVRLSRLSADDVASMLSELQRNSVSAARRKRVHSVLKTALGAAYRREIIDRNVADRIDPPKAPPSKKRHALSVDVALKFVAEIRGDRNEALYLLLIANGLRESEAFGLKPADIDLERRTVKISRKLYERKGGVFEEPPKWGKVATIPLAPLVVEPLRRAIAARTPTKDVPYIFTSAWGRPLRRSGFYRYFWRPLIKRIELPYFVPHRLRNTTSTMLKRLGVPIEIRKEILRHASVETTDDVYDDEIPELQHDALERLSDLLDDDKGDRRRDRGAA